MHYSLPGSLVHGIFQAGILDHSAVSYFGDLLNAVTEPASVVFPALAGGSFNHCATWEALTMEYYSAIKTDQDNAVCRNMDGPQDYHTK